MSPERRMVLWVALLTGLLAANTWWAHGRMAAARQAALAAQEDVARCRQLAAALERLRTQPARAGQAERRVEELSARIEAAAQAAGIPPAQLLAIRPQPAVRLGPSPYTQKPTQVTLQAVRLEQLTRFVHGLTGGADGLWARSIRLSAPRGDEASEIWSAEVTVSEVLYAPLEP